MFTRTEKWKEYREKIKNDEINFLTDHQKDLLALDFAKESMWHIPEDADEYIRLLIHKFKVARKIINEIEGNENDYK